MFIGFFFLREFWNLDAPQELLQANITSQEWFLSSNYFSAFQEESCMIVAENHLW